MVSLQIIHSYKYSLCSDSFCYYKVFHHWSLGRWLKISLHAFYFTLYTTCGANKTSKTGLEEDKTLLLLFIINRNKTTKGTKQEINSKPALSPFYTYFRRRKVTIYCGCQDHSLCGHKGSRVLLVSGRVKIVFRNIRLVHFQGALQVHHNEEWKCPPKLDNSMKNITSSIIYMYNQSHFQQIYYTHGLIGFEINDIKLGMLNVNLLIQSLPSNTSQIFLIRVHHGWAGFMERC